MYDQVMVEVCNWCIRFLYKASDYLGMSYEEINVWLFIIIQPGLIIYFFLSSSKWKKKYLKIKTEQIKMTTILPPPDRKNFKSEKEYKKAYKEWNKMFDSIMKNNNYNY